MSVEERPRFRIADFRDAVRAKYAAVARSPGERFHFHTGRALAGLLGYEDDILDTLPHVVVGSFCGVGNPLGEIVLGSGAAVLDVGCGAGMDALIAAREVGGGGRVSGVDLTPEMIEVARSALDEAGAANLTFQVGQAEELPFGDSSFDVVISNAVINLVPDKERMFAEMARVLRPGGVLCVADVVLAREAPRSVKDLIYRWTSCVVGGTIEPQLRVLAETAGFEDVEVISSRDVFDGAKGEENADHYGALGVTMRSVCR